jgi:hypothetical protein
LLELLLLRADTSISEEESQLLDEYAKGLAFLFERYELELLNFQKMIEKTDHILNE